MYTHWWKELWYRMYWRFYRCIERSCYALCAKFDSAYPSDDDVIEVAPGEYELKENSNDVASRHARGV